MSLTRTDLVYRLPIVAITDAAVSMVANTRYEGSIAAFTADRNYTLPAGPPLGMPASIQYYLRQMMGSH